MDTPQPSRLDNPVAGKCNLLLLHHVTMISAPRGTSDRNRNFEIIGTKDDLFGDDESDDDDGAMGSHVKL